METLAHVVYWEHGHIPPRGCDTLSGMGTWWINSELVPGDEASLSITDHGLTVGDGCFETTTIAVSYTHLTLPTMLWV